MPFLFTAAPFTASEIAAFAADKTFFLARNTLETRNQAPQWRRSGSWSSGQDDTAPGFAATRAADNYIDNPTKPILASPTVNEYFLLFDLVESPPYGANSIDALAIIGHNFHLLPGLITVEVQVADNATFSSNLTTIAFWSGIAGLDDIRLVKVTLDTGGRYTTVRYLRVRIATSTTFTTVPELCEIICGQRLQMGRKPNQPWRTKRIRGDVPTARTRGGGTTYYERNKNGVVLTPRWSPYLGADPQTGLDDDATLYSLFTQCGSGTKNFLFIDSPNSNPREAFWVGWDSPDFDIIVPPGGVNTGEFSGSFPEQSPFYFDEVAA